MVVNGVEGVGWVEVATPFFSSKRWLFADSLALLKIK